MNKKTFLFKSTFAQLSSAHMNKCNTKKYIIASSSSVSPFNFQQSESESKHIALRRSIESMTITFCSDQDDLSESGLNIVLRCYPLACSGHESVHRSESQTFQSSASA